MSRGFVGLAQKLGDAIGMVEVDPLHLANLFAAGKLSEHEVGDVLCATGSPANAVFLLVNGAVEVSKPDAGGTLRPIAVLHGPAMLGHMGVIDGSTRSATCVICGSAPANVIHIESDLFRRLITRSDPTGSATRHLVLASLIRQLGNTNRTVSALLDGQTDQEATAVSDGPEVDISNADIALLQAVLSGWSLPPDSEL